MLVLSWFFFFKQKTAYEMRISDWSSDVCSSDLRAKGYGRTAVPTDIEQDPSRRGFHEPGSRRPAVIERAPRPWRQCRPFREVQHLFGPLDVDLEPGDVGAILRVSRREPDAERSEEHTSELQSLMRTSYAVFCLK